MCVNIHILYKKFIIYFKEHFKFERLLLYIFYLYLILIRQKHGVHTYKLKALNFGKRLIILDLRVQLFNSISFTSSLVRFMFYT
jgi:hypothetical protein